MKRFLTVGILCLLVGAAGTSCGSSGPAEEGGERIADANKKVQPKPTAVVLPFANSTGDPAYDPLAENLGDFLTAALEQSKAMTCVDRSALDKVLAEQKLTLAMLSEDASQRRVGRILGARFVITGSFTLVKKTLKINAHLLEVETSRVVRSAETKGKLETLLDLVRNVAAKLAEAPVPRLSEIEESLLARSPKSRLYFARGLGYYYAGMFDFATVQFMQALMVAPDYALARYWTARCYQAGGDFEHARIEAERFLKYFPKSDLVGKTRDLLKQCREAANKPKDKAPQENR